MLNVFEEDSWRAVTHEFAHLLLNYNYPATQGWFDEGFAEYFSSIRLDNKQVEIGSDPELGLAYKEDILGNQTEVRNAPKSLTELLNGWVWLSVTDLFGMQHDTSGYQRRHAPDAVLCAVVDGDALPVEQREAGGNGQVL